ncbi:hypothetical protein ACROYT_G014875 [Oculina patagonica]
MQKFKGPSLKRAKQMTLLRTNQVTNQSPEKYDVSTAGERGTRPVTALLQRLEDDEKIPRSQRSKQKKFEEIVAACGRQKDYFHMAVNKRDKSKECCDLVLLALYCYILPGRGMEIRTLEINHNYQQYSLREFKGQNILLGDQELCRILLDYINNYRGQLLTANSGNILLLVVHSRRNTGAFCFCKLQLPQFSKECGDSKTQFIQGCTQPCQSLGPGSSVNDGIPPEYTSVHYASIDGAIKLIRSAGPGCFVAKTDNAFRIIPIHPNDYNFLGMQWRGLYYYDQCMPMGCSSSCLMFKTFSTAVECVARNTLHLLDDFLLVAPSAQLCQQHLDLFLSLCAYLGGFYYTLGNIRPENRSHKNAIQLLGLATSKQLVSIKLNA